MSAVVTPKSFVPDDTIEPGTHLGEYIVGHRIARGGFGTIWRARHVASGRIAALKILHPELIFQTELAMRFEREAAAASMLRHPNIVEIYERGVLPDGRPYFAMEYVEGLDLDAQLITRGPLLPSDALTILQQLASALSAAHERGIIHRDLKASNVLLSQKNGALRVVLLDFGIAKLLEDTGPHLTGSRAMIGTPACMAPEQIRCETVSAQTDIYALGSLTYHMLTGEQPFSTDNMVATLYLHLHAPPPRPSHISDISSAFDDVVTRAMSKAPGERHANVADFVTEFRAALRKTSEYPPVPPPQPQAAPALGLYVHVHAESHCLDEPDDIMLDDMEAILPQVDRFLAGRGYLLAHDNGNSALYVQPVPERPIDTTHRWRSVQTAAELRDELTTRPNRDKRVQVSIYLHVADASVDGHDVRGGSLLDLAEWVPGTSSEGIYGSSAVLHQLDMQRDTIASAPIRFYRIHVGQ